MYSLDFFSHLIYEKFGSIVSLHIRHHFVCKANCFNAVDFGLIYYNKRFHRT